VRLKPVNPFDLIPLIAHSQSDPRKALTELVQNSLDAGAGSVTLTRLRRRREVAIAVVDDGGGVFPACERPEADHRLQLGRWTRRAAEWNTACRAVGFAVVDFVSVHAFAAGKLPYPVALRPVKASAAAITSTSTSTFTSTIGRPVRVQRPR
jgi:hypothetical protein